MRAFPVLLVFAAVVAVCGQQTASASVSLATGEWVVLSTGNSAVQYGDGGEFQVNVYGGNGSGVHGTGANDTGPNLNDPISTYPSTGFYTFCAATTNVFVPGYNYEVSSVTSATNAPPGIVGATAMSVFGQWLYSRYWSNTSTSVPGSLTGYVPGHAALAANSTFGTGPNSMTNLQVAGAIQTLIWGSLNETPPSGYNYPGLATQAEALFGWDPNSTPAVLSAVDEISLSGPDNNYGYNNPAQTQLFVPSNGSNSGFDGGIPEPATIVIWSALGVGCLGMRVGRRGGPVARHAWSNENRTAIMEIIGKR
jgi:hypothetical protein